MARSIIEMAGGGRIGFVAWPKLAEQIETGDFVANIGRIRRELGWAPRVVLADGLQRTISHYKAQLSRLKARPTVRVES
jgi:UDP-glucose 4-epimerase